jgi:hypothetical protein
MCGMGGYEGYESTVSGFWRDKICRQLLSTNILAPSLLAWPLATQRSRSVLAKEKLLYYSTYSASGVSDKERACTSTFELVRRISVLPAGKLFCFGSRGIGCIT